MSAVALPGATSAPRHTLALLLGVIILLWTLMPIYNIIIVSLQTNDAIFSGNIWPKQPTLDTYVTVFKEDYWYLNDFWVQMLNSLLVGIGTALIVVGIASLASFAITRLRIRFGGLLSNAALLTYVIPASFLAIPFYKIMDGYGLLDNLWSLILVEVTFATPYAIFIFQQYSTSIPRSLEESAKIDGATTPQIFFHIFLPLMMPALVAVGTYALLLAWNEYLYAFLLAVDADQGHRAGRARLFPQQRRIALEPADGRGHHLLDPAARDLLRVPRPHDHRADHRQRQGLIFPGQASGAAGLHSARSTLIAAPLRTARSAWTSSSAWPQMLQGLASRHSSPREIGVGPKPIAIASPSGQKASSPGSTTALAPASRACDTGVRK